MDSKLAFHCIRDVAALHLPLTVWSCRDVAVYRLLGSVCELEISETCSPPSGELNCTETDLEKGRETNTLR